MTEFYDIPLRYQSLKAKLESIAYANPKVKLFSIGKSVLKRKIWAISIGDMSKYNLIVGTTHALEWFTGLVAVKYFEQLTTDSGKMEFDDLGTIYPTAKYGLVVVPCLNPDGVELVNGGFETAEKLLPQVETISGGNYENWQANINGVDLNHNFDAGYELCKLAEQKVGITAPSPRQYGGSHAHSEKESAAIVKWCRKNPPRSLFSLHSQGEEIFWKYEGYQPKQSEFIARAMSAVSGYSLEEQGGLASHGGLKDWFLKEFSLPAFTIEIGKGKNPLPAEDFSKVYPTLSRMLSVACVM